MEEDGEEFLDFGLSASWEEADDGFSILGVFFWWVEEWEEWGEGFKKWVDGMEDLSFELRVLRGITLILEAILEEWGDNELDILD